MRLIIGAISLLLLIIHPTSANSSPATATTLDEILNTLKANEERYIAELIELVSIPSISAIPAHQPDILKAADWVQHRLCSAGLRNVRKLDNPAGPRPAVYADYIVDAAALPTALIYGHYDVQPADPVEAWKVTPPFDPVVKNGALFGRGASDDKGGLLGAIQAVEALLLVDKTLPFNVKFIVEGEEEIGSPFLESFLEQYKDVLAADFVISADGGQTSETQPSLTLGLRGAAALEIEVVSLAKDVHSGAFGGAVQNPIRALTQLLSTLFDPVTNKILVAGFYDKVRAITAADRDDVLAANYDEEKDLVDALGAVEPLGEEGFTTLERIWLRPTLELVGISGGYSGAGIKTVLPARAVAKLAARLVPDQTPTEILHLVEKHIQQYHPKACNVTVRELGFSAFPFVTERASPVNAAAARVLTEVMGGVTPQYVRNGATIPAMAAFQKYLGAETTTFAFALPSDSVHAPDERYNLRQYALSREAYVLFIRELGNEVEAGNISIKKKKKVDGSGGGGDRTEL